MTRPNPRRRAQRRLRFLEQLEDRRLMAVDLKLVHDLSSGGLLTNPTSAVEMGGSLYFADTSPETGTELWKTDGTPAGTQLVADIWPGLAGSKPSQLFNHNGTLFFQADDGVHGVELWRSDGTAAGTSLVADINPGSASSGSTTNADRDFTSFNGDLFFAATDAAHGWELWRTDGTAGGTTRVTDVRPGPDASRVYGLFNASGKLFFTANPAGDSYPQSELFVTDGTPDGTTQLTSPLGTTNTNPRSLVELNGVVYFAGRGELWRTDGTIDGTQVIAVDAGGDPLRNPSELTIFNDRIYFQAWGGGEGRELWSSDGTAEGTQLLNLSGDDDSSPDNFSVVGDQLFFEARTFATGDELWVSDGTVSGSHMVVELSPGRDSSSFSKVIDLNGKLLFFKFDSTSAKALYTTDGTAAGTTQVLSGNFDGTMLPLGDSLILRQLSGTRSQLLQTDGTSEGTESFYAGVNASGSNPTRLTDVAGSLFFSANSLAWQLDRITGLPTSGLPGDYNGLGKSFVDIIAVDGKTFYTESRFGDSSLFVTDGTVAGTLKLTSSFSATPRLLTNLNGQLLFTTGNDGEGLWVSDGTLDGTRQIADIRPNYWLDQIANLVIAGDTLYFTADDGIQGMELWKSDGTADGTQLVADIRDGSQGSVPRYLTNVNGTLYFAADDGVNGLELWSSDGTSAGTVRLSDIALGADGSALKSLTNLGGTLYFQANDGITGAEPWRLDPVLGAVQVADVAPGSASSNPRDFIVAAGTQFFAADDGSSGVELYTTDGTPLGTGQIADLWAGPTSSNPLFLTEFKGQLYFQANDGVHGEELWTSDGTAAGTQLVEDLGLAGGSAPEGLAVVGDTLYFSAITNATGRELFRTADPANPPHLVTPNSAIYAEHDSPAAVSPGGLVWDWDSPDFDGGSLTATISDGMDAGTDVLSLLETGGITLNGTVVSYQNAEIGTVSGGAGGAALTVSFNVSATPAAAQAVLRAIAFSAAGDDPATNSRTVSFALNDGDGAAPVADSAVVLVRREEDPPLLILSGDPPAILEDAGPQAVSGFVANVSPADSTFEVIGNTNPALFTSLPAVDADGVLTYEPAADAFGVAEITVQAVSGEVASEPVVFTIDVRAVNDRPVITINNSATYVENEDPILLVNDFEFNDPDSPWFTEFMVDLLGATSSDVFSIRNEGTSSGEIGFDGSQITFGGTVISSSVNISTVFTGRLRLDAHLNENATLEAIRALMRNITFSNSSDNPPTGSRTVAFNVRDDRGEWNEEAGIVPLTITPVDDPFSLTIRDSATFTEDTTPLTLDGAATVDDPDGSEFEGGTLRVEILEGVADDDRLTIAHQGNGTGEIGVAGNIVSYGGVEIATFSGGIGTSPLVVEFTSSANAIAVRQLLRRLRFENVNNAPPTAARPVQFSLQDSTGHLEQQTLNVSIVPANDPPEIQLADHQTFTEGGTRVYVAPQAIVTDPDSTSFDGGSVTLYFNSHDYRLGLNSQIAGPGKITITGNNVAYGGVEVGVLAADNGFDHFRVNLNANATIEAIQAIVRNAFIWTGSDAIRSVEDGITVIVDDGGSGRPEGSASAPFTFIGINDPPTLSIKGEFTFTEGGPPSNLKSSLGLTDPDFVTFDGSRFTLSISANAESTDRLLLPTTSGDTGLHVHGHDIVWANSSSQPFRLVGTWSGGENGEPLVINILDSSSIPIVFFLNLARFESTSDAPSPLDRTIQFVFTDSEGADSNPATSIVHVVPVNDAPILDNSLNPKLASIAEDTPDPASTQVGTLLKGAVTDPDAGALRGIAITAASNFYGTWQYTLNGGTTWVGMDEPSAAEALLLPGWARVRFLPAPNFNGTVRLFYRAWDQTTGNSGGALNVSGNAGGNKSLSVAGENASLWIKPVNDPPVLKLSGSMGYVHDSAPITLAPWATVQDVDSADFAGGFLRVHIAEGADISNRVLIGGDFTIDANNNVLLGSTVIGRRTANGWGTNDLLISFKPAATPAMVQQLVRAIAFKTVGGSAGTRRLQFSVGDGDGGQSDVAQKTVNVT